MGQKLHCPMCHNLLIPNDDLVTDKAVCFDMAKLKETDVEDIKKIKCPTCKRRIRYFVGK